MPWRTPSTTRHSAGVRTSGCGGRPRFLELEAIGAILAAARPNYPPPGGRCPAPGIDRSPLSFLLHPMVRLPPVRRELRAVLTDRGHTLEGIAGLRRHRLRRMSARNRIRSRMETIGIVLFMLGAVVLSGIVVRALPLGVPTPL